MKQSFKFGRIFGIEVGAHWSLLAIFWLILAGLADAALPDAAPGYSTGEYWAAASLTAVVFFVCLLAHELAHSLEARRRGMEVDSITLWLLGGVSSLRREAPDAGAELRIAVVGPLTSIAAGMVLALVAGSVKVAGAPELAVAALAWLAGINVLLGVFNLIPAFPLDGGRVLRAALWRRYGDLRRATNNAATAGRFFGYLLAGFGILSLAGGALGGLWFILLGWFLLGAADAEQTGSAMQALLRGMKVSDVMTPNPIVVPSFMTISDLLNEFVVRHHCSGFPVVGIDGELQGLIALSQLRQVPPAERAMTRVQDVAMPLRDVPTARPEEPLVELLSRLRPGRGTRVLVIETGKLVGIMTTSDLERALQVAELTRTSV